MSVDKTKINRVKIKVQRISPDAKLPNYQHLGDAGADICSTINYTLKPNERKAIPIGLKVEIPQGYGLQVRSRSGLALKDGIFVLNSPGTIDSGYRGEIQVILINVSDKEYDIHINQRIAQIVLNPVFIAIFEEDETLTESSRGSAGFGSTGKK
jgi:dUTP pyrophosphatase